MFLFAEKVGQLFAVAVVNIVVLRELGPGAFGYLGAATAILAILLPLSNFGQVMVLRELSTASGSGTFANVVKFGLSLTMIGSIVGAAGMVLAAWVVPEGVTRHLLLILSLAFIARPLWGYDAWYRATGANYRAAIMRLIGVYTSGAGRLVVALTTQSLTLLALFVVFENLLTGVLFAVDYAKSRSSETVVRMTRSKKQDLVAASFPMLLSSFAVMVYMRVDQPMLLAFSGSAQVGLYSAAANLSDALSFLPTVISALSMPVLFGLHRSRRADFVANIRYVMGVSAGLGYIVMIVGIAVADPLIHFLYGGGYSESVLLLQVLLCSVPFVFSGVIQSIWIAAARLQNYQLAYTVLAAFLNVCMNFLLIPIYGALGAACTTVFAHATASILGNLLFRETRPIVAVQMRALRPVFAVCCVWSFIRTGGDISRMGP